MKKRIVYKGWATTEKQRIVTSIFPVLWKRAWPKASPEKIQQEMESRAALKAGASISVQLYAYMQYCISFSVFRVHSYCNTVYNSFITFIYHSSQALLPHTSRMAPLILTVQGWMKWFRCALFVNQRSKRVNWRLTCSSNWKEREV